VAEREALPAIIVVENPASSAKSPAYHFERHNFGQTSQ
jgi:hypothetical protein